MILPLGITVVAYPKKDAMICIKDNENIAPAKTVNLECFIALKKSTFVSIHAGIENSFFCQSDQTFDVKKRIEMYLS